ncbi:MAG TPA: hypothetical protein VI489_04295 [Candidatus Brocadiaceae bacterium]
MKLQIDVNAKEIRVEQEVNLFEFIETVKKLIHPDELKEYKLVTGTVIEWINPITIQPYQYPLYPINPPWYPVQPAIPWTFPYRTGDPVPSTEPYRVTCECSTKQEPKASNFVFNIEI